MVRKYLSTRGTVSKMCIQKPIRNLIDDYLTQMEETRIMSSLNPIEIKRILGKIKMRTCIEDKIIKLLTQSLLNASSNVISNTNYDRLKEDYQSLQEYVSSLNVIESSNNILNIQATTIGETMVVQHNLDMTKFILEMNIILATYFDITGELVFNYSEASWIIVDKAIDIIKCKGIAEQKEYLRYKYDNNITPWGLNIQLDVDSTNTEDTQECVVTCSNESVTTTTDCDTECTDTQNSCSHNVSVGETCTVCSTDGCIEDSCGVEEKCDVCTETNCTHNNEDLGTVVCDPPSET
jgi:hypothetical protein